MEWVGARCAVQWSSGLVETEHVHRHRTQHPTATARDRCTPFHKQFEGECLSCMRRHGMGVVLSFWYGWPGWEIGP